MSSNEKLILSRYKNGSPEEKRSTESRGASLEFHYTKKHLAQFITPQSHILEVGCGTGYYGIYYADKCNAYVGIDIVPSHIEIFKQKISQQKLGNVSCAVGDATNMTDFKNNSFDVVLCLGPMYHLNEEERTLAFAECARVCKPHGILAFAYINRVGLYAGACLNEKWKHIYPNAKANEYVLQKFTDDARPGLFWYTMPDEIEKEAAQHNLTKIKNLGTDFLTLQWVVDAMTDERFEVMKPLYDEMTSNESCTGMSNHALLVCKKR